MEDVKLSPEQIVLVAADLTERWEQRALEHNMTVQEYAELLIEKE